MKSREAGSASVGRKEVAVATSRLLDREPFEMACGKL